MKIEIELYDAKKILPKEDGMYFVVCETGFTFNGLPFYQGRWNCSVNSKGELITEHEFTDVVYWSHKITLADVKGDDERD